jgi:uncharacterized protein YacL
MEEQICSKCHSKQMSAETRQVHLPRPLSTKELVLSFGGLLILVLVVFIVVSQVAPVSIAVIDQSIGFIGGAVVLFSIAIWYFATRRERTVYLYRCESCGRRWSKLGIDKYTSEDQQAAKANQKALRGFLWAFAGLIGLVMMLALFFEVLSHT